MKESWSRKLFMCFNTIFFIVICLIMLFPILKVVAQSLSDSVYIEANEVILLPKGLNFDAYIRVLSDPSILNSFKNSLIVTLGGTFINLLMTSLIAYPLSRTEYLFKKQVLFMITLTMIFTAPLIPQYLVIRNLGLDNKLWAVIIPSAISGYNFFIMRSFFMGIPGELIDSSRIDGCSELRILFSIILPLSKASLATLGLFYGVGHWNALQAPLIYLRDTKLHTLQVKLYQVLQYDSGNSIDLGEILISPISIRMTTIVVAMVPILMVYPFLQKYFVQGATLGSVKE